MTRPFFLRKPHVAAAALYVAAAAAFIVQMGEMSLQSLLVPLICMGIMGACVASSLKFKDTTIEDLTTNAKEVITLLATVAYAGLIYVLGFYIASFLYALFIFLSVSGFSVRLSVASVLNALGIVAAIYAVFNLFLDYFVPEGLLLEYWL